MRSFLAAPTSDEELLNEMNLATSETDETSSKLRTGAVKKVTINECRQAVSHDDLSPILEGIELLRKQMSEMQGAQAEQGSGARRKDERRDGNQENITGRDDKKPYTPYRVYKCKKCIETNAFRCQHCFSCGSEHHQARNCDQKNEERLQRK
jgi:hypothetical protein